MKELLCRDLHFSLKKLDFNLVINYQLPKRMSSFYSLLFFAITTSCLSPNDIRIQEEIVSLKYYDFRLTKSNQNPPLRSQLLTSSVPLNWLSKISDSRLINSLSLPGTHDTASRYGGPPTICQDLTIQEQLSSGVRVLDIRCRHISDVFMIHHGIIYQHLSFGSGVRDVCIEFLKQNPSEFIYMSIKEEYDSSNITRSFGETMQSYIDGFENYFFLDPVSPTLGQVRGKIVILRRFQSMTTKMGNYINFSENAIFTSNYTILARVQDCYVVSSLFARATKWEHIQQLLNESKSSTDENELFWNFCSGVSALCYPFSTAEYINPLIGNYLQNEEPYAHVGIIMFDYINYYYNDLIYHVIQRDFAQERIIDDN